MFIKTLAKRSLNKISKGSANFYSIIGLFNSEDSTIKVVVCPEDERLEGKVYPIEPSKKNISNAIEYAQKLAVESGEKYSGKYFTAVDRMRFSTEMARAVQTKNSPCPKMLFFLPSAYFSNDKIIVNLNPYSCRTPKFNGNTNIKSPVYGFAGVEVFIINVQRDVTSKSKKVYDYVNYFVCQKHPPIHEGFLDDPALGEALAKEAYKNPLLDQIVRDNKFTQNAELNNENAIESIKYQICIKNHPEIMLYGNVVSLYDFQSKKAFRTADEILDRLQSNIVYILSDSEKESAELKEFVKHNVYVRCISGFRIHEGFFGQLGKEFMRIMVPLNEECSHLHAFDEKDKNRFTCLPPIKRVKDEAKRLMYTVRPLALLNPDNKGVSYPLGQGLILVKQYVDKESDQSYEFLSLEAGVLNHNAEKLTTRFFMEGTKIDLSDQGILREEILPLLQIDDPEVAAAQCAELYAQLVDNVQIENKKEEETDDVNMEMEEPAEKDEKDEKPEKAIAERVKPSEEENLPY